MLTAIFAFLAAAQERPDLVLSGEALPPGAVARFGIPHKPFPDPRYPFAAGYSDEGSFRVAVPTGKDVRVWTWHAPSAQPPKHLFSGHPAEVTRLGLSRDAHTLATADKGGDIRVWDLATGEELLALADEPAEGALAVGPRGRFVFRAGATGSAIWETTTKKRLAVGDEKRSFVAAAFSPDGKLLVTADKAGKLELWEPRTLKRVGELAWAPPPPPKPDPKLPKLPKFDLPAGLRHVVDPPSQEHDGGVVRIAFTADGKRLITAGASVVRAWDVETRKELWRAARSHYSWHVGNATAWSYDTGKISGADISADGKFVAIADVSGNIHLLDGETGKDYWMKRERGPYDQHYLALGVVFHPNGKWLASHSAGNCAELWDIRTSTLLATTGGHTGAVSGLAFSPDGKYLASLGREDYFIDIYDLATRRTVARTFARVGHGNGFGFTANGKYIITGPTYHGSFAVGEFIPGVRPTLRMFNERGSYGGANAVCVDPRAPTRFIATSTGAVVRGVDIPSDKWVVYGDGTEKTYIRLSEAPYHIALAPDVNRLVVSSGSYGRRAQVFDLKTGQQPITLEDDTAASGVAVTPDGKLIAVVGKGVYGHDKLQLCVWDGETGKRKFQIDYGESHGSPPAFTPNGKRVALGVGGEVVLIDIATAKEVVRVKAHAGTVWRVAFSPDGKRMASCADDGQTLLWDVDKLPAKR